MTTSQKNSVNDDNSIEETAAEACYLNPMQENDDIQDVFGYTLQPDEMIDFEIGYIIDDDCVNEQLYYMIGYGDLDDIENKFYPLGDCIE